VALILEKHKMKYQYVIVEGVENLAAPIFFMDFRGEFSNV